MVGNKDDRYILALEKQIGKVLYFSEMENISDTIAVHEVRKSFKRIRALLRFLPDEKNANKVAVFSTVVKFGRILSNYRNYCVNLQIFERILKDSSHISERKLKAVKETMVEKCQKTLEEEILEPKVRIQILNYFKTLENELTETALPNDSADIIHQYIISYGRCMETYSSKNLYADSERIHSLRKRLKVLFYQTNYLKFENPRYFKSKSSQLETITELLGEEHDLYILYNELQKKEYELEADELEVLGNKIKHQRDLIIAKIQPRLRQIFVESIEEFAKRMNTMLKKGK